MKHLYDDEGVLTYSNTKHEVALMPFVGTRASQRWSLIDRAAYLVYEREVDEALETLSVYNLEEDLIILAILEDWLEAGYLLQEFPMYVRQITSLAQVYNSGVI